MKEKNWITIKLNIRISVYQKTLKMNWRGKLWIGRKYSQYIGQKTSVRVYEESP